MGFLYCPNCGMSISDQASIPACPKCYHPFNAQEWRRVQAQKDAVAAEEKNKKDAAAAEEKRKKEEEEQRLNYAKNNNECPSCHNPISWDTKRYSDHGGGYITTDYSFSHPYCNSCGWKSPLAFEESENWQRTSKTITNWEYALKRCHEHGY